LWVVLAANLVAILIKLALLAPRTSSGEIANAAAAI
jgi:hypothetical protein